MSATPERTWPDELDNDACSGPLQPDELARWRRSKVQLRVWMALFWVMLAAVLALLWATYRRMGDPAPVHVGPSGVDRWGSRSEYLTGNLIAAGLTVLFGPVFTWLMPKIPMDMTNSTSPGYWKTPERYPISTSHTAVFLMSTMASMQVLTLAAGLGYWELAHARPFPQWLTWTGVAVVAAQLITGLIMLFRALRPPQWWKDCRRAHGHRWD